MAECWIKDLKLAASAGRPRHAPTRTDAPYPALNLFTGDFPLELLEATEPRLKGGAKYLAPRSFDLAQDRFTRGLFCPVAIW